MAETQQRQLAADALAGLWSSPPTLPPRWFYDERGSRLFEEITQLPEYYPTRRETEILRGASSEIARLADPATLTELGAGSSVKTRLLLDAITGQRQEKLIYIPVDVSAEMITDAADQLRRDYSNLIIDPCIADFGEALNRIADQPGPRLLIFLGGTIGNLSPQQRNEFFHDVGSVLQPHDHLLLGADLVKSTTRLTAAYDDRVGVTAEFNRNLIEVLRRELRAVGLYADDFDHVVRWNPIASRVEMWLRTRRNVNAYFQALDRDWTLPAGTEVLTEISTKFVLADLHSELTDAGMPVRSAWLDPDQDYSLTLTGIDCADQETSTADTTPAIR